jgi:C4-dicarboxylate-specific signal transduction histidine kinase
MRLPVATEPCLTAPPHEPGLAEICHALSQPLTALRCALDLAVRQEGTREEYLGRAVSQCERLTRIVEVAQTLAAAAAPSPGGEDVDLAESLREVLEELRPLAEGRGCHLDLNCRGSMMMRMDPARLRSILYGVVHAMLGRGHHFDVRICLTRASGCVLTLESRPAQPLPQLTAQLGILSRDSRRLGLAIAERALTAAGGKLQLDAAAGTMTVHFPAAG